MTHDAIIIGFGKGGKTLAADLASRGLKVALVEQDPTMYGGTCINVGCIPSKRLVLAARKAAEKEKDTFAEKQAAYLQAVEGKNQLTGMLRQKNHQKLAGNPNITLIDGKASFVSNREVRVSGHEETLLSAEKIFINTGSMPVMPPIPGLADNPHVYDSKSLMALETLPQKLAIIGGGYIGLEFAFMYADYGSEVTVLEAGDTFLPREDRDMADAILQRLKEKNIRLLLGAKAGKAEGSTLFFAMDGAEQMLDNTAILVAVGRKANTEGLGLENTDVRLNERGMIMVDEQLKTTAENIWAMGDVCSPMQFTYTSLDDYRVVRSSLFEQGAYTLKQRRHVPTCTFLSPSYARVGLTEQEARAQGYDVLISKQPAAAIPNAQVLQKPQGLLKAVLDNKSKKILGAMLLCERAEEIINIIKLAMDMDATYPTLGSFVFTHPTMAEALNDLFSV